MPRAESFGASAGSVGPRTFPRKSAQARAFCPVQDAKPGRLQRAGTAEDGPRKGSWSTYQLEHCGLGVARGLVLVALRPVQRPVPAVLELVLHELWHMQPLRRVRGRLGVPVVGYPVLCRVQRRKARKGPGSGRGGQRQKALHLVPTRQAGQCVDKRGRHRNQARQLTTSRHASCSPLCRFAHANERVGDGDGGGGGGRDGRWGWGWKIGEPKGTDAHLTGHQCHDEVADQDAAHRQDKRHHGHFRACSVLVKQQWQIIGMSQIATWTKSCVRG